MAPPLPRFQGLTTARLCVRRFTEADLPSLLAYRNDPVAKHFQGWPAMDERSARRFTAEMMDAQPGVAGEWFQFALETRAGALHIGDVALYTLPDPRMGEVGYTLAPTARRQGYATEGAGAVIDYAFRVLGMHRVTATLEATNAPSAGVCARLGMRCEAHRIACSWVHERWCDEYQYAVLEHEWLARHPLPLFSQGCRIPAQD